MSSKPVTFFKLKFYNLKVFQNSVGPCSPLMRFCWVVVGWATTHYPLPSWAGPALAARGASRYAGGSQLKWTLVLDKMGQNAFKCIVEF